MKRFTTSLVFLILTAVLVVYSQNIGGADSSGNLTFTGTVSGPTASPGDNTTKFSTTAFVANAISGFAPLASPAFTGVPTAPTAAGGTNTTQVATTAFVTTAATAGTNAIPRPNVRRWAYMTADGSNGLPSTLGIGDKLAAVTSNGAISGTAATSSAPAIITITTGAASSANAKFASSNAVYETGRNIRFEAYEQMTQAYTNVRNWAGVSANNLNGSDTPAVNFAAFRASTNASDVNYQCVTDDGTTATVTGSGVTIDTNYHKFEIVFNDGIPNVQFFLDGSLVCTNTSHLPSASTALFFLLMIDLPTGAVSRTMSMGWGYVESDK